MTLEELTPEAVTLMRRLANTPQAIEDSALVQLLQADNLVMGDMQRMLLTSSGRRLLKQWSLAATVDGNDAASSID